MAFTRIDFTDKITRLFREMIDSGEKVILDYCKRSDSEQKMLYDLKLSKCDGVKNKSKHQKGMAVDLYFLKYNDIANKWEIDWNKDKYHYWHKTWELTYEGKRMISWDLPHFEL